MRVTLKLLQEQLAALQDEAGLPKTGDGRLFITNTGSTNMYVLARSYDSGYRALIYKSGKEMLALLEGGEIFLQEARND